MKNLYVFHGADRKVGVTMTAQSVAEWIAGAAPEAEVLFVSMCGRQNVQYQRHPAPPIDRYRSRIESGVGILKTEIPLIGSMQFVDESYQMQCERQDYRKVQSEGKADFKYAVNSECKYNNLYAISGIENEQEERIYRPETAERFLANICPQFEIVIVDSGSEIDCGIALGALSAAMAKNRFLVLPQSEAALARYEKMKALHDLIEIEFGNFVINKYSDENPYSTEYIKQRLYIENRENKKTQNIKYELPQAKAHLPKRETLIYKIRRTGSDGISETEYKTFLALKEKQYTADTKKIGEAIIRDAGIAAKNREKRDMGKGNDRVLFRRLYDTIREIKSQF